MSVKASNPEYKGKLLIISYYFAPKNEVAAIRVSKFAKYLVDDGWDIDVLTFTSNPEIVTETIKDDTLICKQLNEVTMYYAKYPSFLRVLYRFINRNSENGVIGGKSNRQKHSGKSLYNLLRNWVINSCLYYSGVKTLKIVKKNNYNVIFSSYGPMISAILGIKAKKMFPDAFYIQDFRDCIYENDVDSLKLRIEKMEEKRILNTANYITVASADCIRYPYKIANAVEITNGFDPCDYEGDFTNPYDVSKVNLYFGGTMYTTYDNSMLAKVISKYNMSNIVVHYAGRHFGAFSKAFLDNGVEGVLVNHGYITRHESIQYQKFADGLIAFSHNSINSEGLITGKIFELIAARRPIICIISGDKPDSRLEKMFSGNEYRKCFRYYYQDAESQLYDYIGSLSHRTAIDKYFESINDSQYTHRVLVDRLEKIITGGIHL